MYAKGYGLLVTYQETWKDYHSWRDLEIWLLSLFVLDKWGHIR